MVQVGLLTAASMPLGGPALVEHARFTRLRGCGGDFGRRNGLRSTGTLETPQGGVHAKLHPGIITANLLTLRTHKRARVRGPHVLVDGVLDEVPVDAV
jgi:hypothetical protein